MGLDHSGAGTDWPGLWLLGRLFPRRDLLSCRHRHRTAAGLYIDPVLSRVAGWSYQPFGGHDLHVHAVWRRVESHWRNRLYRARGFLGGAALSCGARLGGDRLQRVDGYGLGLNRCERCINGGHDHSADEALWFQGLLRRSCRIRRLDRWAVDATRDGVGRLSDRRNDRDPVF